MMDKHLNKQVDPR